MKQSLLASRRSGQQVFTFLVLALLLAMVFQPIYPVQASSAGQQSVPRFEPGSCNFSVQTSLVEGKDLQCGTLVVPELYANLSGPTIQLSVVIVKSLAANPAPDPVVMLQGGPGGSTIDTYLQLLSVDQKLRDINRDIILFDQRGTEFSKPSLFCQQYYDESIRQLDENISSDVSNQRAQAALKACHDQFVSQGIDLSAFNSLENAADVNSLKQALGFQKINLYGVSYGTLLALHVMKLFPQDLRSVTLDSVVPPQTNFILDAPRSENRALDEVFTTCGQLPDCNSAYPNLKNVFYGEVDQLNSNKAQIQVRDPQTGKVYPALLDGDTLINAIVQMLYITEWVPLIPRVIYNVRAGDYAFIEQVLSLVTFDRSLNLGMYFSVLCAEDADFQLKNYDLSGLPKELASAEKDGAQQFLQTCSFWNVKDLSPSVDQPVSSSIPTLLLAGKFDPITPPAYAEEAAQTLSNSYLFTFPVGGHGQVTSGPCQDQVFIDFLNNPNQKPGGTCVAQQTMSFSTPGSLIHLPILIKLLNLQDGAGIQLGIFVLGLLFLLTAFIVYPIIWLVHLFRRPAPPATHTVAEGVTQPVPAVAARRPFLYRLAPWLAVFAGLLFLAFMVPITVTAIRLALANDSRILLGLPGSSRPLFVLPIIIAIVGLFMFIAAVVAWARRSGSVGGKIYFSLLTISAWVCLAILAMWGMLTALFTA